MQENITKIQISFQADLNSVKTTAELETIRLKYLSKTSGLTTKLLQELPKLTSDDKRAYGPALNQLKKDQETAVATKLVELNSSFSVDIDLTIPGIPQPTGHLHPTTTIIREMNEFFRYQGFSIGEGPEIEDVEYNFRRLNLPEGHPATDLQDSLFIEEPQYLMRTHTSSVETRMLSNNKPPLRVVVPGKCYRNETTSLTNSAFFYQYQGFVVDKGITIGHLKDTLTKFHQFLFGDDVKLRFRYKYYPEVSPGMGVDMECRFCHGKGCQVCKYRGYIEVLGSGMIHYNTLKACGIDPEVYSGFAFGMGLDRLVMSKYGITDIRKLYGGEIVYL
jgi:phenylalanyl-tRNA synthetase alpha chain